MTEMLGDFPFVDDADRANCLAFYLLPAVRQMIVGNTPMHVFGASKQGTGKGRLVDLWGLIWLGRTPSLTSEPHSDKEWGEKIGSSLMSGAGYFFVDNIKYAVKSGALAVALTTSRFSYRILGESKVVDLPVRWCWAATANNIKADSDIVRRFVRTRLDANCERPELRIGVENPRPPGLGTGTEVGTRLGVPDHRPGLDRRREADGQLHARLLRGVGEGHGRHHGLHRSAWVPRQLVRQ